MAAPGKSDRVQRLLDLAEGVRGRASSMRDPATRQVMLQIAEAYESLAQLVDSWLVQNRTVGPNP